MFSSQFLTENTIQATTRFPLIFVDGGLFFVFTALPEVSYDLAFVIRYFATKCSCLISNHKTTKRISTIIKQHKRTLNINCFKQQNSHFFTILVYTFESCTHFRHISFILSVCQGFVICSVWVVLCFQFNFYSYCDKRPKVGAWQPDAQALQDREHDRCRI